MVNEAEIRALVIKESRWKLLATLRLFYPGTATFHTLCLTLPTVELRHMRVDLSYLIAKGYVEWVTGRPNMPWNTRDFRLTATGVETADRINEDSALQPGAS